MRTHEKYFRFMIVKIQFRIFNYSKNNRDVGTNWLESINAIHSSDVDRWRFMAKLEKDARKDKNTIKNLNDYTASNKIIGSKRRQNLLLQTAEASTKITVLNGTVIYCSERRRPRGIQCSNPPLQLISAVNCVERHTNL